MTKDGSVYSGTLMTTSCIGLTAALHIVLISLIPTGKQPDNYENKVGCGEIYLGYGKWNDGVCLLRLMLSSAR